MWASYRAAGLPGLWVLKGALVAASGALMWALLRQLGLRPFWRAFGVVFWFAALIPRSNLRTESFSLLAFLLLLGRLESDRRASAAHAFLFFAAWANLHAGFLYGLVLLGLYAACAPSRRPERLACLAAGAAGTLLNPYGWSIYAVFWEHFRALGDLQRFINEWGVMRLASASHWPIELLFLGWAAALGLRCRRAGRLVFSPLDAATALFFLGALRHVRLIAFFAAAGVPAALRSAEALGTLASLERVPWLRPLSRMRPWLAGGVCCVCFFAAIHWGHWADPLAFCLARELPVKAADFLEANPSLAAFKLYNPWGWGGYLGFRLGPAYRVFQDGRYLFHPFLREEKDAFASPQAWASFLDRHGVGLAVVKAGSAQARLIDTRRWKLVQADADARVYVRDTRSGSEGSAR